VSELFALRMFENLQKIYILTSEILQTLIKMKQSHSWAVESRRKKAGKF
jgi:hypothetical protein